MEEAVEEAVFLQRDGVVIVVGEGKGVGRWAASFHLCFEEEEEEEGHL